MRRKELVELECVYCDVCGLNITNSTRYGYIDTQGISRDICANPPTKGKESCEKVFLRTRNLESADRGFEERFK